MLPTPLPSPSSHSQMYNTSLDVDKPYTQVVALRIMQSNYEQMVKVQQTQPNLTEQRVSDEFKFKVFQNIIEQLFFTFSNISVNNFPELSACVFGWLEEHCKPQTLREMVTSVLQRLTRQ